MTLSFKLPDAFIETYENRKVDWGYPDAAGNALGEIVFLRTYSRLKENGGKERWHEVCRRVVEGMFSIQKDHCKSNQLPWNELKAQNTAKDAYDRLFNFKWTPPGRGLWVMGTDAVHERKNSAPLQNCCFISTSDMTKADPGEVFAFIMEALMLGIGVGFDTKGSARGFDIHEPSPTEHFEYIIPDTREGWAESLRLLLNSYLKPGRNVVTFDYSEIRPFGEPIKTFGGTASGPGPLRDLHDTLRYLLDKATEFDSILVMDIVNLIGKCVVAGNVRRSATIAIGDIDDTRFLNAKDYSNPEFSYRSDWGWGSNNSVSVSTDDDLSGIVEGAVRNGEPGVVWLDMCREYGRLKDPKNYADMRVAGTNPCAEQPLESGEMCVSGDTLIQTRRGLYPISDLTDKHTEIWNGEEWSEVTPFYTGQSRLFRVHISDGSYLDVTENHEWSIFRNGSRAPKRVKTFELKQNDKLPSFEIDVPSTDVSSHKIDGYAYGWVAGDGYIDGNIVCGIVQEHEQKYIDDIFSKRIGNIRLNRGPDGPTGTRYYVYNLSDQVDLSDAIIMRRSDSLPENILTADSDTLRDFFGGWIDTDGSLIKQIDTDHYVLYGKQQQLRQAQILLRRIGVNHSTLRRFASAGDITNIGTRNRDLYRLLIPSYECPNIATRIKVATRIGSHFKRNPAHQHGRWINTSRRQRIVSIEPLGNELHSTYCFSEPKKHMGVFGNVLTFQCTLCEVFLNRHDSLEDFQKTLKIAYLYAKSVTLLPTHWPKTNAIMQRNRRIGTSLSGIANFVDNHSLAVFRAWADAGYETVNYYDDIYSEWLCVRNSVKTTTVKPSGTVSILTGASPGVHWTPGGRLFARGIVFQKDDPIVPLLSDAGYTIVPSVYTPDTSVFVQFPIKTEAKRSDADVSIFEKVNLAAEAQYHWSDNAVSVTVSFDKETEAKDIGTILDMYTGRLKTISFLPRSNDTYEQMPYQSISEEVYSSATDLGKIDFSSIYDGEENTDAIGEKYCTNDSCQIG